MKLFFRLILAALVFAPVPALAVGDCASSQNLWHVHRRLDGAIDQLQHDQRDYGGHRVAAINDLQNARNEIVAAEQSDRDDLHCARAGGSTGGSDANWGRRGQGNSNRNLMGVRRWVENMVDQLQRDNHDYGGHRVNAINDMQAARNELVQAERYR